MAAILHCVLPWRLARLAFVMSIVAWDIYSNAMHVGLGLFNGQEQSMKGICQQPQQVFAAFLLHMFAPKSKGWQCHENNVCRTCWASMRSDVSDAVAPGLLVEFSRPGKPDALGALLEPDGKTKWKVAMLDGSSASINPKSIQFVIERSGEGKDAWLPRLKKIDEAIKEPYSFEFLESLYDITKDEGEFDIDELSELAFTDISNTLRFALHHSLVSSEAGQVLFRSDKSKTKFLARPVEEVETRRTEFKAMELLRQEQGALKARIAAASSDAPLDLGAESEDVQLKFRNVAQLGSYASMNLKTRAFYLKEFQVLESALADFMTSLGFKKTPEGARTLMIQTGLWDRHTNLDVIRYNITIDFTDEQHSHAASLALAHVPDLDSTRRRDLTNLTALAIDDASTVEVDDAISIERLDVAQGGGEVVWIHIADPTRYVPLGSVVEIEAERRGATLYLPTGPVPMIPLELSAGPCSLTGKSHALSIGVRVTSEGEIDPEFKPILTPSLVNVERITFDEVDEMLDDFAMIDNSTTISRNKMQLLNRLERISSNRVNWRQKQGSSKSISETEIPAANIKVGVDKDEPDGWSIDVSLHSNDGPSQRIVSESMLLANEVVAKYFAANSLPTMYRVQNYAGIYSEMEAEAYPEGICRTFWMIRKLMGSSYLSQEPAKHAGLGLDAYLQFTSPIRRYADLAQHYQLKAHLRGDPLPFTAAQMKNFMSGGLASNYRKFERNAKSHWLQEWLVRHQGESMRGMVVWKDDRDETGRRTEVLLQDFGAVVECDAGQEVTLGEEIIVAPNSIGSFPNVNEAWN